MPRLPAIRQVADAIVSSRLDHCALTLTPQPLFGTRTTGITAAAAAYNSTLRDVTPHDIPLGPRRAVDGSFVFGVTRVNACSRNLLMNMRLPRLPVDGRYSVTRLR